ncbi:MAG: tRNA uridine(34) 5-carboxymethylaminomethyl modification radical SAM/GNAT enzyme Elp3 [Candidatus Aenigmarchaeota archaeon]|nr:tRNA uridine(34) 5-carboxymethylaminomethyl modification radical SAM/GNAT enzyme Elp3 [Candidatus Aenigmarchaeota archaeon]
MVGEINKAKKEIIDKILAKKITNKRELELEKIAISKKYNLNKLFQNAELIDFVNRNILNNNAVKNLSKFLQIKPVRTGSGVSVIAVMCKGYCPGSCIYCPTVDGIPKSYTGVEPATMRAKRVNFNPAKQIKNRLKQLEVTGHPTDKCELIVMGGTFLAMDKDYKKKFMKSCYDALNGKSSKNLEEAKKLNQKSEHRCVGLTFETRADFCKENHIKEMMNYGATRVELGVQTVYDDVLDFVNRGHKAKENIVATRNLKDNGLKVTYHIMLGLPLSDQQRDFKMVKKIFSSPDYKPDEIKIYPTLVIPGTKLYEMYKKGEYTPLSINEATELLIKIKQIVPRYVRIKRIMRDISEKKVVAGPKTTNLRQLTEYKMKKAGMRCSCIRCREYWHRIREGIVPEKENIKLYKISYNASGSRELFLSYEDKKNDVLIGFLRLRLCSRAFVRELHVYGPLVKLGERDKDAVQHEKYGQKLLKIAEEISADKGYTRLLVTSGIGVRLYYKKFGYKLNGFYMVKNL